MATRTKLLSGRNINTDSDFSKYIETVSEPGVIEGLQVSTNSVGIGKCWVPCERTNGETIYSLVESFTETSIDTSGTGYVIVEIGQTYIDDGSLINEDGTGVAIIKVVSSLPLKNYLELAELNSGVITDSRNMIKKVGELNTAIESLFSQVADLDDRVSDLEKAGAIDHLEEQALVGENYTMSDTLFLQKRAIYSSCTNEDCIVGNNDINKEIHIQGISNGIKGNTIQLKVKAVGSPTTNLKVEVRKGIKVDVSNTEAYWYGDENEILATGSLAYTNFSTNWSSVDFELDNEINEDEGTLLNIVVYQDSSGTKVVNANNYYILACDSSQWSEAFSFVKVNGESRVRSFLMPYCLGGFLCDKLFSKIKTGTHEYWDDILEFENTLGMGSTNPGRSAAIPGGNLTLVAGKSYRLACYINATINGRYNDIYFQNASTTNVLTMSSGNMTAKKRVYGGKQTPSASDLVITKYTGTGANSSGTGDYTSGVYTQISPIKVQQYGSVEFSVDAKKDKPKELKGIGQLLNCYLFGRLADGSWRDGN